MDRQANDDLEMMHKPHLVDVPHEKSSETLPMMENEDNDHQNNQNGVSSINGDKGYECAVTTSSVTTKKCLDNPASWTMFVIFILTAMCYFHRFIPSAMKVQLQKELDLSDAETAYPFTAFQMVYMTTSPFFGYLSDIGLSRPKLIFIGINIWLVGNILNSFVHQFWQYLFCRMLCAIGQAPLVTLSASIICDLYPEENRNFPMSIWLAAIPLGGGLGYVIGGVMQDTIGWRRAFWVSALPGFFIAFLIFTYREPIRGTFDAKPTKKKIITTSPHLNPNPKSSISTDLSINGSNQSHNNYQEQAITTTTTETTEEILEELEHELPTWYQTCAFLINSPRYVTIAIGYISINFAIGGLADWLPTFFQRQYQLSATMGGLIVGGMTIVATPTGTFFGSYLADKLRGKIRESNYMISAIFCFIATILAPPALLTSSLAIGSVLIFISEICAFVNAAPGSSEISESVLPLMRARAWGITIFLSTVFGDAISPTLIGVISDHSNLATALFIFPVCSLISALAWGISSRFLPPEKIIRQWGRSRQTSAST